MNASKYFGYVQNFLNGADGQGTNLLILVAPLASTETLESSAPMSRPISTYERNDVKPMAIVKPRPQSEVFEEELVKPSLPLKKVLIV